MVTYKAKKFLDSSISSDSGVQGGGASSYTLTNISIPEWWPIAIKRIAFLMELEENWDSYGAKAIDPNLAHVSVNLLQEISTSELPEPSIIPTPRGSIQFEWHISGIDFELEVINSTKLSAYFKNSDNGMEWEDVLDFDLSRITRAIEILVSKKDIQDQVA